MWNLGIAHCSSTLHVSVAWKRRKSYRFQFSIGMKDSRIRFGSPSPSTLLIVPHTEGNLKFFHFLFKVLLLKLGSESTQHSAWRENGYGWMVWDHGKDPSCSMGIRRGKSLFTKIVVSLLIYSVAGQNLPRISFSIDYSGTMPRSEIECMFWDETFEIEFGYRLLR